MTNSPLYSGSLQGNPVLFLHSDTLSDGEVGFFLDEQGFVHEYAFVNSDESLSHCRVDSQDQQLVEDFIEGASNSQLDFLFGVLASRNDTLKCSPGNTACGKKCLPKGQVCRSKGGVQKNALVGGAALVGAGALLSQTKGGKAAIKKTGEKIEEGVVGQAEKIGTSVGKRSVQAVVNRKLRDPSAPRKEPGLMSKAAKSFGKGVKAGAQKEVVETAKKKASSLKDKIKKIATKEIAYLPGERKLRSSLKKKFKK